MASTLPSVIDGGLALGSEALGKNAYDVFGSRSEGDLRRAQNFGFSHAAADRKGRLLAQTRPQDPCFCWADSNTQLSCSIQNDVCVIPVQADPSSVLKCSGPVPSWLLHCPQTATFTLTDASLSATLTLTLQSRGGGSSFLIYGPGGGTRTMMAAVAVLRPP